MEMFSDFQVVSTTSFLSMADGTVRGVLISSLHGGPVTGFPAAPSSSCRVGNGRDGAEDKQTGFRGN